MKIAPAAFICLALYVVLAAGISSAADDTQRARDGMVSDVLAMWRATQREVGDSAPDQKVIDVLSKVPRHDFVPFDARDKAYANRPLSIGLWQTISQPYIVALMTDLADIDAHSRVLEIGTGSGYQAAVLAELAGEVYTMEIIQPLAETAAERLERLGYENVRVRHGDGYYGWSENAPFDAILVTAAASHVPPPLVDQLVVGGKMIIPVGSGFAVQQLVLVEKQGPDRIVVKQMLPVRFVPLTGGH